MWARVLGGQGDSLLKKPLPNTGTAPLEATTIYSWLGARPLDLRLTEGDGRGALPGIS